MDEQEEQRGLEQLAEAWRHRDEDDDETDERTENR